MDKAGSRSHRMNMYERAIDRVLKPVLSDRKEEREGERGREGVGGRGRDGKGESGAMEFRDRETAELL